MDELSASSLMAELRKRQSGVGLAESLYRIAERVAPILGLVSNLFDDYTIHDISHSNAVLSNLDWLLPSDVVQSMNIYELYILIAACYLHDIGMVVTNEEICSLQRTVEFDSLRVSQKLGDPEKNDREILKDFIRSIHHHRSEKYILENYEGEGGLGIDDYRLARAVSIVAKGHRESDLLNFDMFDPKYFVVSGKDPVCLPFLACCLMLADELDITRERTPELLYELVSPHHPVSSAEWDKHKSMLAVCPDDKKIKILAECEEPKIHKAILDSADKIRNVLETIHRVIRNLPSDQRKRCYIELKGVEVKISPVGYLYRDFKFDMDGRSVAKLLMGDRLYNSQFDCIRELLQNSIDTCRLKAKIKADWEPKIRIGLSPDKDRLWVEDNGMGMDEFIIENFLMKIGRSYYKSYEYERKYGGFGLSPISEFGIGILSCFMICNSLVINTLMEGEEPIQLELSGLLEDFVMRRGRRNEPGTTVELVLKEEVSREWDDELLEERIRFYIRHVEFPVTLERLDGTEAEIIDRGFAFNVEEFLNPFQRSEASKYGIIAVGYIKHMRFSGGGSRLADRIYEKRQMLGRIIDNSLSMATRHDAASRFERAKTEAAALLGGENPRRKPERSRIHSRFRGLGNRGLRPR